MSATPGCCACVAHSMKPWPDREACEEIYRLLAHLADWMRNQEGNPHDAGMQRP
jgi:hypothetical protein